MKYKSDHFYKYIDVDDFKLLLHNLCARMLDEVFEEDRDAITFIDIERMINNAVADDSFVDAFNNTLTYYAEHTCKVAIKLNKMTNDVCSWKLFENIYDENLCEYYALYFLDFFKFFNILILKLLGAKDKFVLAKKEFSDVGDECNCKVMLYFFMAIHKADKSKIYFDYEATRKNIFDSREDTLYDLTDTNHTTSHINKM